MRTRRGRWLWLLLLVPIALGLARLRFNVEVLDLLPADLPVVRGLKLYQQHFANARELIITLRATDAEQAESTAHSIADRLRAATNLVASVTWQPPWLERPGEVGELLAYLWLNQPPEAFSQLTNRLAPAQLAQQLTAAREELATSLSPTDIARLSYDPFGLTRLPGASSGSMPGFGEGQEMFSSPNGSFRILFVTSATDLQTYRECDSWVNAVRRIAEEAVAPIKPPPNLGYTGRPAFVAEISRGMEHDITTSVGGTSLIIAALFWLAHRRWKPMLWLLTLLALILGATLALGGLFFGTISVVSMGFAAILLGLAVDYAVVHYQEALAHPDLSIPQVRHAIAPSIFWAAVTTICAFLVLNFGGLPGLGQLGSLVALGVTISACVMIFAFLPPLFPDRLKLLSAPKPPLEPPLAAPLNRRHRTIVLLFSLGLVAGAVAVLLAGFPRIDPTANALRPRQSQAYSNLDLIKTELNQKRDPLWLVIEGRNEEEVARRLQEVQPVLERAASNGIISGFTLPAALWPRTDFQNLNRAAALRLADERELLRASAQQAGFTDAALGLTDQILASWKAAAATPGVFWPTNAMSRWIFSKFSARTPDGLLVLGFLNPPANPAAVSRVPELESALPRGGVWLSGWELLGHGIFSSVKKNLWKLVAPMVTLIFLSLWLAFRRWQEIALSLCVLGASGLCLLAIMRLMGWSWNLLNLMALPLILGTGVDYSIFMQLALRRHQGDLPMAHRSVGRALLLCGATAIAGFGSLAWSSNAGMASLGQVCAVGIAGNMLISVFLLPVWWRLLKPGPQIQGSPRPSSLYGSGTWRLGLLLVGALPHAWAVKIGRLFADAYWFLAPHRREILIQNLLPVLGNDRPAATLASRRLVRNFSVKLLDLWRYEAGLPIEHLFGEYTGWDRFGLALAEKRGVLLLTPHLGNWEFGGPWLTQKGFTLQVVTLAEPGNGFTRLRQQSRARWNIETLVVGDDPFAFLEIIRRLEAGATVALLIDRPPARSAVPVELFGRPFNASIAAAELARASGCILLPVHIPRGADKYYAHILPPIPYDRPSLRDRDARIRLTQQIVRAFEPAIGQHPDQWYHFVPVWPQP